MTDGIWKYRNTENSITGNIWQVYFHACVRINRTLIVENFHVITCSYFSIPIPEIGVISPINFSSLAVGSIWKRTLNAMLSVWWTLLSVEWQQMTSSKQYGWHRYRMWRNINTGVSRVISIYLSWWRPGMVTLPHHCPDSTIHGANMGPIWGRQDPVGPHVDPMNFASWVGFCDRNPPANG